MFLERIRINLRQTTAGLLTKVITELKFVLLFAHIKNKKIYLQFYYELFFELLPSL